MVGNHEERSLPSAGAGRGDPLGLRVGAAIPEVDGFAGCCVGCCVGCSAPAPGTRGAAGIFGFRSDQPESMCSVGGCEVNRGAESLRSFTMDY